MAIGYRSIYWLFLTISPKEALQAASHPISHNLHDLQHCVRLALTRFAVNRLSLPTTMKFEHLIEINNPANSLIPTLSLEHLWQGLILRAKSPKLFVPHLDECHLLETTENTVSRASHFGKLVVHDTVTFSPYEHVHYQVPPQGEVPASSLKMTIESPQPDVLFVRFVYEDAKGEADNATDAMYDEFRKSAYHEADIDTIRIIRDLAHEGRLDAPLV